MATKHYDPAAAIIILLGGLTATARAANTSTASVQRWRRPQSVGGCDGFIPRRHHTSLIRAGRKIGVTLTPASFVDPAQLPKVKL